MFLKKYAEFLNEDNIIVISIDETMFSAAALSKYSYSLKGTPVKGEQ